MTTSDLGWAGAQPLAVEEVPWWAPDTPAGGIGQGTGPSPGEWGATLSGDIDLAYPFRGRWLVQNSPADRVPSHGTGAFATDHAIDFVPVGEGRRTAPVRLASLFLPEPPQRFPGFGRSVLAPVDGVVVAADDEQGDHAAHRGLPSVAYALTQRRRAALGWPALAGNHLLLRAGPGVVVALCHLQRGSIRVGVGDTVQVGQEVGRCGNSGNSTEPHLHVQAVDRADVDHARPVPVTFRGSLPRTGAVVEV